MIELTNIEGFFFSWSSDVDTMGGCLNLVAWGEVCKPKIQGGLEILDLQIMNKALHGKWLVSKPELLWVKIIDQCIINN